jgi:carbamoyltransferase
MITWGISANSHDAALSVFVDEKLAFASHSERFSGKKNDRDLCSSLVVYAADRFGYPDQVCWYEQPFKKTVRQLWAGQGWKASDNDIKKYLSRWAIDVPIKYNGHHSSHAYTGYLTSKFDDACVIVIDAIGEWNTLTIWQGRGNDLKLLYKMDFPHSVGLWYSAMTQRCHLKPNEEEYILMGMAAYGDPNRLSRDIIDDFIDFSDARHPVKFKQNLHRGCLQWRPDLIVNDTFDIAAATQQVYEIIFERVLQFATGLSKSRNLVLMGGCALNCLANRLTGRYYDQTWIYPNPGDAGSAIGAVLAQYPHWREYSDWTNPYLGHDMGQHHSDYEIVDYLKTHKICGLARGPAEFGPRALGNRSLLADPRGDDVKARVNDIKQRQQFRPFAPAILEEYVDEYFDMPPTWTTSPYMQVIARCRKPKEFPAIIHKDGTSRVQTVANDGSLFRRLLELWYKETGCPMLLNTSLNIKGQPMVNDHRDAEAFEQHYAVKVFT